MRRSGAASPASRPRPRPSGPGRVGRGWSARTVGSTASDGVRVDGRGCWNWVFQSDAVVVHVVRRSRGAGAAAEVMAGHRPAIWVSDLYGAQRGHAAAWQICLAHQRRDCSFAVEAGDAVFAPR